MKARALPAADRWRGKLFVNAPLGRLADGLLDEFLARRLQPEIGLDGDVLLTMPAATMTAIARQLQAAGLACTLHAPFSGLDPAAEDQDVRHRTRELLIRAFDCIAIFQPRVIVVHPHLVDDDIGLDERLAVGHRFWPPFVERAAGFGVPVMFENTYERSAAGHRALLEQLASPYARFCFDTGHVLAFAGNTWPEWIEPLADRLGHLHLHDNDGTADQHRAPGCGCFDFAGLFRFLRHRRLQPTVTIEPHVAGELDAALSYLNTEPAIAAYFDQMA